MSNRAKINIMVIEDEDFDVRRVKNTIKFSKESIYIKNVVSNGNSAIDLLKKKSDEYDIVIMDFQIAGGLRGEELIKIIKEIDPSLQIIVITKMTINITDFEFANKLMKAGAFWYCTKYPGDIEDFIYQPTDFLMSIFNAYEKRQLEKISNKSNKKLTQKVDEILNQRKMIGDSEPTRHLLQQIEKYSESEVNILVNGPSGTGKELVAHNIHYKSRRRFENFVPINCGSLPHDLVESELFGYEKGAFTGANSKKPGLFEIAHNGTIFLDEVSELPLSAQVKLLRVIQNGEIEKIGRTGSLKVDVRIIAATNKDLEIEVKEGRFREDLYYRLNVVPIYILPLNMRKADIPSLINHFLDFYSLDMNRKKTTIKSAAMNLLINYDWPGNVRELKNVVQRLLLNSSGDIDESDVRNSLLTRDIRKLDKFDAFLFQNSGNVLPLKQMERKFREKYFKFVRDYSESDADAAKKLGLAPPNFHRMCKELGLK
ncbi:MAG TPA: sigma-54 dependent transcriptional regulator [Ignavibacteriaceae bacterium]|nr:sigma-54 dependent transcriptional regulator [Ignavibacteriaceae bacterium]